MEITLNFLAQTVKSNGIMLLTQLRLFANIYRDCMVTQSQPRTQSDVKAKCMQTPVQQLEPDFQHVKKAVMNTQAVISVSTIQVSKAE